MQDIRNKILMDVHSCTSSQISIRNFMDVRLEYIPSSEALYVHESPSSILSLMRNSNVASRYIYHYDYLS